MNLPKNLKEIKPFLGLTGECRKFIKSVSTIANSIIKCLKEDAIWKNTKEDNKKYMLTCNFAIGAVLSQEVDLFAMLIELWMVMKCILLNDRKRVICH